MQGNYHSSNCPVFIKFRIVFIVFRDIKLVTAYETHLVGILVAGELGKISILNFI